MPTITGAEWPANNVGINGPFEHSGNLYVVLKRSGADNVAVFKSADGGDTWSEMDSASAPAIGTNPLVGITSRMLGDNLWIAYCPSGTDDTGIVAFDMTTDTYGTPVVTASLHFPAPGFTANPVTLEVFDSTRVNVYYQHRVTSMGQQRPKVGGTGKHPDGTAYGHWIMVGNDDTLNYQVRGSVRGEIGTNVKAYTFYTHDGDTGVHVVSIDEAHNIVMENDVLASGASGGDFIIVSGTKRVGADTVLIVGYVDSGGVLRVKRATETSSFSWGAEETPTAIAPEVTATQPGVLVDFDGAFHLFFVEDATGDLYRTDDGGAASWGADELIATANVQGLTANALASSIGIVYDDGGTVTFQEFTAGNHYDETGRQAAVLVGTSGTDVLVEAALQESGLVTAQAQTTATSTAALAESRSTTVLASTTTDVLTAPATMTRWRWQTEQGFVAAVNTAITGLAQGDYRGLRVQDKNVSGAAVPLERRIEFRNVTDGGPWTPVGGPWAHSEWRMRNTTFEDGTAIGVALTKDADAGTNGASHLLDTTPQENEENLADASSAEHIFFIQFNGIEAKTYEFRVTDAGIAYESYMTVAEASTVAGGAAPQENLTQLTTSGGRVDWYKGAAAHQLIAFDAVVDDVTSDTEVFTMQPDGSGLVNISEGYALDRVGFRGKAAWHPDGEHLVIMAENLNSGHGLYNHMAWGVDNDLWVISRDGTFSKRIWTTPSGNAALAPKFNADATKLIFAERVPTGETGFGGPGDENQWDGWRIRVGDFDTATMTLSNVISLQPNAGNEGFYETTGFTQDGRMVYVHTDNTGTTTPAYVDEVFTCDLDGTNVTNHTNDSDDWDDSGQFNQNDLLVWVSSRFDPNITYPADTPGDLRTELFRLDTLEQLTSLNTETGDQVVCSTLSFDKNGGRVVFQAANVGGDGDIDPQVWLLELAAAENVQETVRASVTGTDAMGRAESVAETVAAVTSSTEQQGATETAVETVVALTSSTDRQAAAEVAAATVVAVTTATEQQGAAEAGAVIALAATASTDQRSATEAAATTVVAVASVADRQAATDRQAMVVLSVTASSALLSLAELLATVVLAQTVASSQKAMAESLNETVAVLTSGNDQREVPEEGVVTVTVATAASDSLATAESLATTALVGTEAVDAFRLSEAGAVEALAATTASDARAATESLSVDSLVISSSQDALSGSEEAFVAILAVAIEENSVSLTEHGSLGLVAITSGQANVGISESGAVTVAVATVATEAAESTESLEASVLAITAATSARRSTESLAVEVQVASTGQSAFSGSERASTAILAILESADAGAFVESGSLVITAPMASRDNAPGEESVRTTVQAILVANGQQAMVESESEAIAAAVAGVDAQHVAESGAVSVASVTESSDTIASSHAALVVVNTLVEGNDALPGEEAGRVTVLAAVTGTDALTIGQEQFDETGRSMTVLVSTATQDARRLEESGATTIRSLAGVVDVARRSESEASTVLALTRATDGVVGAEAGAVLVLAETAGAAGATGAESGAVVLVASVVGEDTRVGQFESGTVTALVATQAGSEGAFNEAAVATVDAITAGRDVRAGSESGAVTIAVASAAQDGLRFAESVAVPVLVATAGRAHARGRDSALVVLDTPMAGSDSAAFGEQSQAVVLAATEGRTALTARPETGAVVALAGMQAAAVASLAESGESAIAVVVTVATAQSSEETGKTVTITSLLTGTQTVSGSMSFTALIVAVTTGDDLGSTDPRFVIVIPLRGESGEASLEGTFSNRVELRGEYG